MPPRKGWAAVYCRLSKEDEEKTARESESIRNQRELLLNWAQVHGYRAIWRWRSCLLPISGARCAARLQRDAGRRAGGQI